MEGNGTATTTNTVYLDHLGGTNVVANASGTAIEALSYYPYGASRVNSKTGTYEQSQQFTGHEFDDGTGLYYMRARYQNPGVGRFESEDPAYLAIGTQNFEKNYQRSLAQHLSNPQALNAYAYANNNPVTVTDPQGEIVPLLIGAWAAIELALSAYDAYDTAHTVLNPNASVNDKMLSVGGFALGMIAPGGGYGTAGKQLIGKSFGKLGTVVKNIPTKIGGFTKHGLNQVITRGVTPEMLLGTTKNASVTLKQAGGNTLYLTKDAGVVLNKQNEVVTAYTSNEFKPHVTEVLKKAANKKD